MALPQDCERARLGPPGQSGTGPPASSRLGTLSRPLTRRNPCCVFPGGILWTLSWGSHRGCELKASGGHTNSSTILSACGVLVHVGLFECFCLCSATFLPPHRRNPTATPPPASRCAASSPSAARPSSPSRCTGTFTSSRTARISRTPTPGTMDRTVWTDLFRRHTVSYFFPSENSQHIGIEFIARITHIIILPYFFSHELTLGVKSSKRVFVVLCPAGMRSFCEW